MTELHIHSLHILPLAFLPVKRNVTRYCRRKKTNNIKKTKLKKQTIQKTNNSKNEKNAPLMRNINHF